MDLPSAAMSLPDPPQPPDRSRIRRRLITDEQKRPVAVQIDYEDWLEIERLLSQTSAPPADIDALLERSSGIWTHGDGLDYQQRLRDEWGEPER